MSSNQASSRASSVPPPLWGLHGRVCKPLSKEPLGPPYFTGRIADDLERHLIISRSARCHTLWTALLGASCDFDDCLCELASRLGWVPPGPSADLSELLDSASTVLEEAALAWTDLRVLACEVFADLRGEEGVEISRFDPRSFDQVVSDTQFHAGRCIPCLLGVPGTARDHATLAGWVAHRRTDWAAVAAVTTGAGSSTR